MTSNAPLPDRSRRRCHSWVLRAAAGAGVLLALAAPALGSDGSEFDCEEAAAHLSDCCPSFVPQALDCTYDAFSCDPNEDPNPDLTSSESHCIEDMSCDQILAEHVCEKVTNGEVISCGT